jgi:hypothetical protein
VAGKEVACRTVTRRGSFHGVTLWLPRLI